MIEQTAFEPKNTNGVYDGLGNVTGLYRYLDGTAKVPGECPAGYLCVQDALMPFDGYDSAVNGNSWYFLPCSAASVAGLPADRTGIFAANTYRVESVEGDDSRYNLGANTLGIPIPELERGTFTELMLGEIYKFGEGNFNSPPNEGDYVPIEGPIFGDGSSAPPDEDGAVWGKVIRIEPFNDGPRCFGNGYCVKIFRNGQSGGSPTPPTPPEPPTPVTDSEFTKFLEGSSASITVPDDTTAIRQYAFYRAPFTSVTLPDTLESIAMEGFSNCALTSLYIPNSVKSVGNAAFSYCYQLTSVEFENPANPNLVLDVQTFSTCRQLQSVVMPDSITSIPKGMFLYCTSLTEIVIPDTVTSIGGQAFNGANSLRRVTFPSGLRVIDERAFDSCSVLESVTLPNTVTTLAARCFRGCVALTSLVIPASVRELGTGFAEENPNLASVTIPQGVTKIGSSAFSADTNLRNVVLPSSITQIGAYAFYKVPGPIRCRFAEGAVSGAPWGCTGTIIYNYNG